MSEFGYAGTILKVDLSHGNTTRLSTADYADRFLGGRGIAAKIYWDMVPPQTRAYDPENCLIYITGPVAGFNRFASCRWQICGKSPSMEPEYFSYANLGERWGNSLKYAGYDGLIVQGKADKPVYIFINNGNVEIRDASFLWGKTAFEAIEILQTELGKGASVLAIAQAAENLVSFATMLADNGASGASGLGSVMGSKLLKALVVAGDKKPVAADPERLNELANRILKLRKDTWKNWLLAMPGRAKLHACNGCGIGCWRKSYEAEGGRRFKFFCQAGAFYMKMAIDYNGTEWKEVVLLATRLCDRYGLDTTVIQPMIEWLGKCYQEGILSEEATGIPLSKIGSAEFMEVLTKKIALREGFGDWLAQGTIKAAEKVGGRAPELVGYSVLTRANETRDYDPRLVLPNALLYATEPRRPISQIHEITHALEMWLNYERGKEDAWLTYHDFLTVARNFWGGDAAADFTTYEGKALAAKKIQDRTYAKECLILCDFMWPIIWVRFADDHTGDPTMESQILSAVTGKEIDEAGLNRIGERVFNMQRAILLRQGWGGRWGDRLLDYLHDEPLEHLNRFDNFLAPGKNGEMVSRRGFRIDREDFEKLKSEYYELRGWDIESGLLTEESLRELELGDVAGNLKERGLLG